tara:strand:- start:16537 stop:16842 length:306 start_codon:yes stop_codon:yes gene_type:complete
MTLGQKQRKFTKMVGMLIQYAYFEGFELSLGDAFATDGHRVGSLHYSRLAIDLNLFKDGKYLTETIDHAFLGEYWKRLDPECTWGGDFGGKDGNHYSYGEH